MHSRTFKEMTEFFNTAVVDLFELLHRLDKFESQNRIFTLKISGASTDEQTADLFVDARLTMMHRLIVLHTP